MQKLCFYEDSTSHLKLPNFLSALSASKMPAHKSQVYLDEDAWPLWLVSDHVSHVSQNSWNAHHILHNTSWDLNFPKLESCVFWFYGLSLYEAVIGCCKTIGLDSCILQNCKFRNRLQESNFLSKKARHLSCINKIASQTVVCEVWDVTYSFCWASTKPKNRMHLNIRLSTGIFEYLSTCDNSLKDFRKCGHWLPFLLTIIWWSSLQKL